MKSLPLLAKVIAVVIPLQKSIKDTFSRRVYRHISRCALGLQPGLSSQQRGSPAVALTRSSTSANTTKTPPQGKLRRGTWVGWLMAQERGLLQAAALALASSDWGMSVHAPSPSKRQPW